MRIISIYHRTFCWIIGIGAGLSGKIWIATFVLPVLAHGIYRSEKNRLTAALCLGPGEVILYKKIENRRKSLAGQILFDIGEYHIFTNRRVLFISDDVKNKSITILQCINFDQIAELEVQSIDQNMVVSIFHSSCSYKINFNKIVNRKLSSVINAIKYANPNINIKLPVSW